jgi:hypothetical protein
MLAGVEILLERMKTNPEEFIEGGYSKWSRVIDSAWSILTEEEQTALNAGVDNAKREHFNGEVMRVLSGNNDEEEVTMDIERFYKGKHLMQGASPSILTSNTLRHQIEDTLNQQFDEAYARKDKYVMKTASKLKDAMKK